MLAVGDRLDSKLALKSGAVYLFERDSRSIGDWRLDAKLYPDDPKPDHWFGTKLSLQGGLLAVGVPFDNDLGPDAGAAYVFERKGSDPRSWVQVAKLTASGGGASEAFGSDVGIHGDTCVVGASLAYNGRRQTGGVYVFERDSALGLGWTQTQTLIPDDAEWGDRFGSSVALGENVIVVGSFGHDGDAPNTGAVYVYSNSSGGWTLSSKLIAPDGVVGDQFGGAVALSGGMIVAGAPGNGTGSARSGAAYVFERNGLGWTCQAKLTALQGSPNDGFGTFIAADREGIVISAPFSNVAGPNSGSAYVYRRSGPSGPWVQANLLLPSDIGPNQNFNSPAVDADVIAVGAAKSFVPGSVYLFAGRENRTVSTYCRASDAMPPGCRPEITTLGSASASGGSTFEIRSGRLPGAKLGVFLYSHGGPAQPDLGGSGICIPSVGVRRSTFLTSGGTDGECDGGFLLDWNAWVQVAGASDPALTTPGTIVHGQFAWFDLFPTSRVGWTNAVAFQLCP